VNPPFAGKIIANVFVWGLKMLFFFSTAPVIERACEHMTNLLKQSGEISLVVVLCYIHSVFIFKRERIAIHCDCPNVGQSGDGLSIYTCLFHCCFSRLVGRCFRGVPLTPDR
jgi:hypothetical protein